RQAPNFWLALRHCHKGAQIPRRYLKKRKSEEEIRTGLMTGKGGTERALLYARPPFGSRAFIGRCTAAENLPRWRCGCCAKSKWVAFRQSARLEKLRSAGDHHFGPQFLRKQWPLRARSTPGGLPVTHRIFWRLRSSGAELARCVCLRDPGFFCRKGRYETTPS